MRAVRLALCGFRLCLGIGLAEAVGYGSMAGMPPVPENCPGVATRLAAEGALPADSPRVNNYDSFAEAYSAESDAGIQNAYYERPAILALAGDVTGRRILDAGCGSGPLFAALRDRGARRKRRARAGAGGRRQAGTGGNAPAGDHGMSDPSAIPVT
jgi:hypothetical protein